MKHHLYMHTIPEWPALNPWTRPIRLSHGQLRLVTTSRTQIDLGPRESVEVSAACELLARRWTLTKIKHDEAANRGLAILSKLGQIVDARVLQQMAGPEQVPVLGRALMRAALSDQPQSRQTIAAPDPLPPSVGVMAPAQWQPLIKHALRSVGIAGVTVLADRPGVQQPTCPDLEGITLAIVVGELDWHLVTQFMKSELAHLIMTPSAATVDVGPLVLPRKTPCLRCVFLARRDIDPHWSTTTEAIRDRQQPPVDPWLAQTAAQISAALTHAWITDRGTVPSVMLHTSAPFGETSLTRVTMHPLCDCHREPGRDWPPDSAPTELAA